MTRIDCFEDALAIFKLEGLELTEQEIQILRELDQLPFSEEEIRSFLNAGRRGADEGKSN